MKRKYTLFGMLLIALILISSVSASDYRESVDLGCVSLTGLDEYHITEDTILCTDTYPMQDDPEMNGVIIMDADNVYLDCDNAVIVGAGLGRGIVAKFRNNITIKNCEIRNYGTGIFVGGSPNNTVIKNNLVHNCPWSGITLGGGSNNIVINNTAHSGGDGIYAQFCSNELIANNTIYNSGNGIKLYGCSNSMVANNKIYGNSGGGIWLETANLNTVINNTVHDNIWSGIFIYIGSKNNIINNTAYNNNVGIDLYEKASNNLVKGNEVYGNAYHGMSITMDSNYNLITENLIHDNIMVGIVVFMTSTNTIDNNEIFNNKIVGIDLTDEVSGDFEMHGKSHWVAGRLLYYVTHQPYLPTTIIRNNNIHHNPLGIGIDYVFTTDHYFAMVYNNFITDNEIGIQISTSGSLIYNNYFSSSLRNVDVDSGRNRWNIQKTYGKNIIGGSYLGGNYWHDYTGTDLDGDGLGDTEIPYNNGIDNGGDYLPLVEEP